MHDVDAWQVLRQGTALGWNALNEVFDVPAGNMALAFRQSPGSSREIRVEGVKLIDLGMQLGQQTVALVVGITAMAENRMGGFGKPQQGLGSPMGREHIDKMIAGRAAVDGVEFGEHQISAAGDVENQIYGFLIRDFAEKYDVRILT